MLNSKRLIFSRPFWSKHYFSDLFLLVIIDEKISIAFLVCMIHLFSYFILIVFLFQFNIDRSIRVSWSLRFKLSHFFDGKIFLRSNITNWFGCFLVEFFFCDQQWWVKLSDLNNFIARVDIFQLGLSWKPKNLMDFILLLTVG